MNKFTVAGLAAAALLAPGNIAISASPNFSGVYLFHSTQVCPARQTITTKFAVTSIQPTLEKFVKSVAESQGGLLRQSAGSLTFTPGIPGGQTGSVTLKAREASSWLLINKVDGVTPVGSGLTIESTSLSGTYTMTASALTLSLAGEAPQTYVSYYGGINATTGLSSHAEFIAFPGQDCSISGSLDRK